MLSEKIQRTISQIEAPDPSVGEDAQAHIDNLTKPPGSLGRLEELARRLAVIHGTARLATPKPAAAVFAADHGVSLSGVSPFPREVTAQMVLNFINGGAGINVLASQVGAPVKVVDVGVDFDFGEMPALISAKVARGSKNLLQEPAMTIAQTCQAMEVGIDVANALIDQGADLLIPGEMGIGNTTPSAALTSVFCAKPPSEVTGRGAGLDDEGLARKTALVEQAIALHKPDPANPLATLAALGGLEIAAICGYVLAAAANRVPLVADGFIGTAGALCAVRLAPPALHYILAGHASVEPGHGILLAEMGLAPILHLNMRLGEGTGAALAVGVIKSAVAIYNEMATFESAGVSK